jgi:hypothetical protein
MVSVFAAVSAATADSQLEYLHSKPRIEIAVRLMDEFAASTH